MMVYWSGEIVQLEYRILDYFMSFAEKDHKLLGRSSTCPVSQIKVASGEAGTLFHARIFFYHPQYLSFQWQLPEHHILFG